MVFSGPHKTVVTTLVISHIRSRKPIVVYNSTQVAKIICFLLSQYKTLILARYSKVTLGQYSFLENSFDIGKYIGQIIVSS